MHHIGKITTINYPLTELVLRDPQERTILTIFSDGSIKYGESFNSRESVDITNKKAAEVFWDLIAGNNPFELAGELEAIKQRIIDFLDGKLTLSQLKLILGDF